MLFFSLLGSITLREKMDKIKRVSRILKFLFSIVILCLPILLVVYWIDAPEPLGFKTDESQVLLNFIPGNIEVASTLSLTTKFLGFLISMIPNGIYLLILFYLVRLFRLYERGVIFTEENIKYIRYIAYCILFCEVLKPIHDILMSLTLTWNNPPGERMISAGFGTTNISMIITALIILMVSWIMTEACRLNEEQKYTV